jgi:hypothetical protein
MGITREQALAELYMRGKLNDSQKLAVEELARRGVVQLGPEFTQRPPLSEGELPGVGSGTLGFTETPAARVPAGPAPSPEQAMSVRQKAFQDLASEIGLFKAFFIGAGQGFANVGRGLNLMDPPDPAETEGLNALHAQHPIAAGAGQMTGESAPFMLPGTAAGRITSLGKRALISGLVGGAEGAIVARGQGGDTTGGLAMGTGIGVATEVLFPVLSKLGRKVYQHVTGRVPRGALLDAAGNPTPEFQAALDQAGISMDELTADAVEIIKQQKLGANPEQVARRTVFEQEQVPMTKGELTKDFQQLSDEQKLLSSATDPHAEPFRQYKLDQSNAIQSRLRNFTGTPSQEETGQLIQEALTGRKELLRTRKNDLYKEASEIAKSADEYLIFTDGIQEILPDRAEMRRLELLSRTPVNALEQLLVEFGIYTNKYAVKGFENAGGEITPLSLANFDTFRQALNRIKKTDKTQVTSDIITKIKGVLDTEMDEIAEVATPDSKVAEVVKRIKKARDTVTLRKVEFSEAALVGKIAGARPDGVTPIIEASKVYNKLAARSTPVEQIRKVTASLARTPEGADTLASLQATTLLDLIDAGFGTESRKINGIKVFSPAAFKKRVKDIGWDKVQALFSNDPVMLRRIYAIDKIASELIPPSATAPKGEAPVLKDLIDRIGFTALAAKVPGGAFLLGAFDKMSEPIKQGLRVRKSVTPEPDVADIRNMLERTFPGIASALGIASTIKEVEDESR